MMSNEDPVSLWIDELRQADDSAAQLIWEHFATRLHEMARVHLHQRTKRVYDEEDVVQSMFRSVCRGLAEGRFPDLRDRNSLWRLMLVITSNKISNRHRYDRQQRRDHRRTIGDTIFAKPTLDSQSPLAAGIVSREPTPEFAAEFEDTCEQLLSQLTDPDVRDIAILRMEGFNDSEIAERMNCSRRTVQRRLEIIRRQWSHLEPSNES